MSRQYNNASLVAEIAGVRETDLLYVTALRACQHLGDIVVLHVSVRMQMNLRLGILPGLIEEGALELLEVRNDSALPDHGPIGIDLHIDDLRRLVRQGNRRPRQIELDRVSREGGGPQEGKALAGCRSIAGGIRGGVDLAQGQRSLAEHVTPAGRRANVGVTEPEDIVHRTSVLHAFDP